METKTTMADLQNSFDSYGTVIKYGNYVLESKTSSNKNGFGNTAKIYKATETPIDGWGEDSRCFAECALELVKESETLFEDAGHAIQWCLTQVM